MNYYTNAFPGRKIYVANKSYLYFGGTSYLGLQTDFKFQKLYIQNVKKYGTNYGASRKSNIKIKIFEKAETTLASFVGSEASISLSSGFLAGQTIAQLFNNENYQCFYAPNTHAALIANNSTVFDNFDHMVTAINKSVQNKIPVVFLDAIDTLTACYPKFNGLQKLPLQKIILVIDDSHGIGIMGNQGSGAYKIVKKMNPKELLVCSSLGKGLGIQAGAIFGTKTRIKQITNTNLFGGASPAAPASLATLIEATTIYEEKKQVLQKNIQCFLKAIHNISNFKYIEKHPVFTFKDPQLTAYLKEQGILITNFKYPNQEGELISRIVISANHTTNDIEVLAKSINFYKN